MGLGGHELLLETSDDEGAGDGRSHASASYEGPKETGNLFPSLVKVCKTPRMSGDTDFLFLAVVLQPDMPEPCSALSVGVRSSRCRVSAA
eukprot:3452096-Amphidinium_carterae.1